ncbi:MAG: FliI/YscN family ATPase [Pseudooceanicola sp.]
MSSNGFETLLADLGRIPIMQPVGRVIAVDAGLVRLAGLGHLARMGDFLKLARADGTHLGGEVLCIETDAVLMLPDASPDGVSLGDRVTLVGDVRLAPDESWIGRIIDPYGQPMDGFALRHGPSACNLRATPPPAAQRRGLGRRLETGMAVFNTMLPIVEGQRIGLFSGSGVGKSNLLAHFAKHLESDLTVVALIGERGRELREFVENVLGPDGMARSIVIAATSDQSPLVRRRCAWAAMAVAEHFRDHGRNVLFLADSITRFAEAHREVAVTAGELPALRGYPPSTAHMIMQLCERAGPGVKGAGAITAILSVLVAGSDMEEPIADILRGVLDGHVVLDRKIAERGRFPAIDLLRSVSRSLPAAATEDENTAISSARALLGAYAQSEMMIRAGLYTQGSDPQLDQAISVWPDLDAFIAEKDLDGCENSFNRLRLILRRAQSAGHATRNRPLAQPPQANDRPGAGMPMNLPKGPWPQGHRKQLPQPINRLP